MNSRELVRRYFDREARRFDAIYEVDKPLDQRLVDRLFRRVVIERFRLILGLAPSPGAWSVLDVGCGSGRYSIALARAGAARVLGVDVSEAMVALARQEAARAGVAERCEFKVAPFVDFATEERFDAVVATGYFDYLEDPAADLARMAAVCRGRIFASFPKRWECRAPLRKLRFLLAGAFVRFYSKAEVLSLFERAGLGGERLALVDLGRDWVAVARAF
jgi:2-polyprenyl-3-methyl-5-hydroxy-6-metoxy-1,4-benzoquinol methylase